MWIFTHGFLNALYSIGDQILNVEKQQSGELRAAIDAWHTPATSDRIKSGLQPLRNAITHRGSFRVTTEIQWEDDFLNDTVRPRSRTLLTIKKSDVKNASPHDLFDRVETEIAWWNEQVGIIADFYVNHGGRREELFRNIRRYEDNPEDLF